MKIKRFITILIAIFIVAFVSSDIAIPAGNNNRIPVFIGFKNIPGPSEQALVRRAGGRIKYSYNIVPAIAASLPLQALQGLANNPNITYIEQDAIAYAIGETLPWGVDRIDAEQVHPTNTGLGVNVAVLDSGIDDSHPDLYVKGGVRFYGNGYTSYSDENYQDDNGHGTHVAGTVAALWNEYGVRGVAPEASLYAVKVLEADGSGWYSDIIAGINWCSNTIGDSDPTNDIAVINMSIGGSSSSSTLEGACNNAYYFKGILLVAAAGNSGHPTGKFNTVEYPARYDSVIAVAATDSSDLRARWSSSGPAAELSAPGVDIPSTFPTYPVYMGSYPSGYVYMSGTSMASPHVAGVAALVKAANPTMTNIQIRQRLIDTADDLGTSGKDDLYGWGLVDADEAVGLIVIPATGSISGNVTDSGTGSPIAIANITADNGTNQYSTTTNGNGDYYLDSIPVGTYSLVASATGYVSGTTNATVSEGVTSEVDFALSPQQTGGDITVTVSYTPTGGTNHLLVTVALEYLDYTPVIGTEISFNIYYNDTLYKTVTGTTGDNGTLSFLIKKAPGGFYQTDVIVDDETYYGDEYEFIK